MAVVKKGLNKARGIGGLTTKVHAVTDGLGNPLYFMLSPGNRNDIVYAEEMLEPFNLNGKKVLADMGYDQEQFAENIRCRGGIPIIPSRVSVQIQREIDEDEYKERHLIENLFQRLKNHRRFSTRYDKLDTSYFAVVLISACLIWLF